MSTFDLDAFVEACRAAMSTSDPRSVVKELLTGALRTPACVVAALPATRAEADATCFAIARRLCLQVAGRCRDIAHDLHVWRSPCLEGALAQFGRFHRHPSREEMRCDRRIAGVREFAHGFARPGIPAGQVVNDDHTGIRARPGRCRDVGFDLVAVVAFERDAVGCGAVAGHYWTSLKMELRRRLVREPFSRSGAHSATPPATAARCSESRCGPCRSRPSAAGARQADTAGSSSARRDGTRP